MATGNSTVLVTNFFLWSKGIYLWKLLFFTWDEKYQSIKIEFNFVGIQTVCEQAPGENGQKKKKSASAEQKNERSDWGRTWYQELMS